MTTATLELLASAVGAAVIGYGCWLATRRTVRLHAAEDYRTAYEAKLTECEQCRGNWETRISRLEHDIGDLREVHRQVVEYNRHLMHERDTMRSRITELEVKVHALELELQAKINRPD